MRTRKEAVDAANTVELANWFAQHIKYRAEKQTMAKDLPKAGEILSRHIARSGIHTEEVSAIMVGMQFGEVIHSIGDAVAITKTLGPHRDQALAREIMKGKQLATMLASFDLGEWGE